MSIIQISKIQHRTGANTDLPQLSEGELGFATDERKLYIGNDPMLYPPANTSVTTQTEVLTEASTLNFARISGSGNSSLDITTPLETGQLLVAAGNVWINAGGNAGGYVNLGNIGNVSINGGVNGYVLATDGLGNLSWKSSGVVSYNITDISKGNPAVVTTQENNTVVTGISVTITSVGGMTQLATAGVSDKNKFFALKITENTFSLYKDSAFTIPVNSTAFTTATANSGIVTVSLYEAGTGSPGGANTNIQFNDGSGLFGGTANLTYSKVTNQLTLLGNANISNVNSNFFGPLNGTVGATTPNTAVFTTVRTTSTLSAAGNISGANLTIAGAITSAGNLTSGNFKTAGLANVNDLDVTGNVLGGLKPVGNNTQDLGTPNQRWRDLWLSGNTIYIGDQTITTTSDSITISGQSTYANDIFVINVFATSVQGTFTAESAAQPNITSLGELTNLTVKGPVNFSEITSLNIPGGYPNYVLTTDGAGNVNWNPVPFQASIAAGSNLEIQYNLNGTFGTSNTFTFNPVTGVLSVPTIAVSNATILGFNTSNVSANIITGNTLSVPGNAATGNLDVTGNANISGNIYSSHLIVNGSIAATGELVADIIVANTSITSLGNLTGANIFTSGSLTATGDITGDDLHVASITASRTANILGTITGANLLTSGVVSATGTVTAGNVATTGRVSATGNIIGGNIVTAGVVTANSLELVGSANVGDLNVNGQLSLTGDLSVGNLTTFGQITALGKTNFGSVSNIKIAGGTADWVIKTDGTGNLSFAPQTAEGVLPGGSDYSIQWNENLLLIGDEYLKYNPNTQTLTSAYFAGDGSNLSNIQSTNITGTVANANYAAFAGDVVNSSQSNITSVGTLTSLSVSGELTAANANLGNAVVANFFVGDGSLITGLPPGYSDTDVSNFLPNYTGNINATNATFTGNIDVTDTVTAKDVTVTGNLTVSGSTITADVSTINIKDPIIEQGGTGNASPLTVDDGFDRGQVLHYYAGNAAVDAFMGWNTSNGEFAFGSNVTISNNVATFNSYGNVRAARFIGDGSQLANIPASAVGTPNANVIPLGAPTDGNLTSPGSITSWTTDTKVSDAIDDLNEALENIRNNTYVKSVSFTATPTAGGAGSTVALTVTSVGNPNTYDVSWGDGQFSNAIATASPTHVYATNTNSPFTVTVKAYNSSGSGTGSSATLTRASFITIYTADPVMGFGLFRASTGGTALSGSNLYASEGETVFLENTTTNTLMGVVAYTINWGDGTTDTVTGDTAAGGVSGSRKSHTYATGQSSGTGTKTITLTLTAHSTANPASIPRSSTAAIKVYNPSIASPNGLSTKTIAFSGSVGTNPLLASGFTDLTGAAVATAGSGINRTIAVTGTVDTVTTSSYAYDADSGVLSSFVNGSSDANITLTTADNSGTSGSLVITAESDYNLLDAAGANTTFALSIYKPTLYKGLKAKVAKSASAVSIGLNSFQLQHSTTGNTNLVEFVKDDVITAPIVNVSSATIANATNGTFRYISGVPYYNTGSPTVTLSGATIAEWIGQSYQSTTTPFQIENGTNDESTTGNVIASQTKTYSELDGAVTYLSGGIPKANTGKTTSGAYAIGVQTVSVAPVNVAAVKTIKVRATNVNGVGAYAEHTKKIQVFTATPTGFVEDNIPVTTTSTLWSDAAKRIVIAGAAGATPAYDSATNYYTSAAWTGVQTIAGTDEAVVRWNQLKHFAVDLTSYLPAGPNLVTGRSGTQYFRGALRRNAKSSISVTITGKISGFFIAAPGTAIDTASTLNGWLDGSQAYNGSGVPGAGSGGNGSNGCAVGSAIPTGTTITATTFTLTLGTASLSNATGNQLLFSIALSPGDFITSWSFS